MITFKASEDKLRIGFIDTETGGLDPKVHAITEIGMVVADIDPKEPLAYHTLAEFEVLIQPNQDLALSPRALEIQGRTLETLRADGTPEVAAYQHFDALLFDLNIHQREHVFVGQYAQFDYGFLRALYTRVTASGWESRAPMFNDNRSSWVCTRGLWHWMYQMGMHDLKSARLQHMAQYYDMEQPDVHSALADAKLGLAVYARMLEDIRRFYDA